MFTFINMRLLDTNCLSAQHLSSKESVSFQFRGACGVIQSHLYICIYTRTDAQRHAHKEVDVRSRGSQNEVLPQPTSWYSDLLRGGWTQVSSLKL